jgi:hypothetical protein
VKVGYYFGILLEEESVNTLNYGEEMYINTKLLLSRGLSLLDAAVLQIVKQNKFEDVSAIIVENIPLNSLQKYADLGLIEYVKPKNKTQNWAHTIRLSSKGSNWLEDLETPEIEEEDLKMYNWLEGIYKKTGKEVGNRTKTKQFIAAFRTQSGICRNNLAYLCQVFISDEEQFEWSKRLQYLFYKGDSVFSVKFQLEGSRLYQYYLKNEEVFKRRFEELDNKQT